MSLPSTNISTHKCKEDSKQSPKEINQPNDCHDLVLGFLDKTERFMREAFADSESDISHHLRTVYWIRELKPDTSEALLVSGMAHDIERAFHGDWKAGSSEQDDLQKHQEQSAQILEKFLKKAGATDDLILRVRELVLHHEEGGGEDQNVLCDADALAWLEEKALRKVEKAKREGKEEEMKEKLDNIMGRISSPKTREIAQKWYDKAVKELYYKLHLS